MNLQLIRFILLFAMILATSCFRQIHSDSRLTHPYKEHLQNHIWVADQLLGLDSNTKTYQLSYGDSLPLLNGNITQFTDSLSFRSDYMMWCGNGDFTGVSGHYNFPDSNIISITVETVTYFGGWKKPTEHREPKILLYSISINRDGVLLTKRE
ncbi:MAG: hypothetical protein J0L62_16410 [Bacteroidetes bacterium]|nr:hypothetical protein [Bacteroidota bacterium]